jgi:hypothetical protein
MCGDCMPGYVVGLGSASCTLESSCAHDQWVVWGAVVVALVVMACLQMTVVSGVWLTGPAVPTAKLKLAIYFVQVRTGGKKIPGREALKDERHGKPCRHVS